MQTPIDFFLTRLKEELPKNLQVSIIDKYFITKCYEEAKEYEEKYKQSIYKEASMLASSREYWNEKRTTH